MPFPWYVLVPVSLYLARWSINPVRSRVPALRRVLAQPLPTRYAADTFLQLVLGSGRSAGLQADDIEDDPRWEAEWHFLGFLITTTAFNELPARLVGSLTPSKRRSLARFYDAAIVWAALGVAMCVVLLLWEATATTRWLWAVLHAATGPAEPQRTFSLPTLKRSSTPLTGYEYSTTPSGAIIHPLIPGVTLPWSHAPMLIAAFLLGQLMHEPGHSMAGALSGLVTLSTSVHLSPVFPSASVRLPALELRRLPPREKIRVGAAGCLHNLVFAAMLWAACAALGSTQRNVGDVGRVVLGVDKSSPLYEVLPVGMLLTHLDDQPLSVRRTSGVSGVDPWTAYLTSSDIRSDGWCLNRPTFEAQATDCCMGGADTSKQPSTLCFLPLDTENGAGHCLLPDILTAVADNSAESNRCPCASDNDVCIVVDPREQVLRIGMVEESQSLEEPSWLLWQGSRQQVLRQVITSDREPPNWIPEQLYPAYLYVVTLKTYVIMISFTLAILNLLPFPVLDGGLCLTSFLELAFPDEPSATDQDLSLEYSDRIENEVEEGYVGDRLATRWRSRVQLIVAWGVGGLAMWVLGGLSLRLAIGGYE